jgi:hypothetical protein
MGGTPYSGGEICIDPQGLAPVAQHVKTAWYALDAAPAYTQLEAGDKGHTVQHKVDAFNRVYKPHREELIKSLELASRILDAASDGFGTVEAKLLAVLQGGG